MKKSILIVFLLIIALSFSACQKNNSSNDTSSDKSATVTLSPEEIKDKIADAVGADNFLCDTEIEEFYLTNTYGFDLSKIESYVALQNSISSINPDTIIILKTKDDYADTAVDAINTIYAQSVSYIRQYPFNTAKVLNARLYSEADYVIYVIAGASYDGEDSEEENRLAVSEYEKIDEAIKDIFGKLPENKAVVPEDTGSAGGLIVPDESNDEDSVPLLGG